MSDHKIEKLIKIMDELREKCPWDKKQTLESLRPLTIEETYELADAITDGDLNGVKEELGDLLLQIVLQSKIAEENDLFSFDEVIDNLCEKLIRRHPYVFKEKRSHTIEEQREAYFRIKDLEKLK